MAVSAGLAAVAAVAAAAAMGAALAMADATVVWQLIQNVAPSILSSFPAFDSKCRRRLLTRIIALRARPMRICLPVSNTQ